MTHLRKKLQQNKSQVQSQSKPKVVRRHRSDLDRLYVEYKEKQERRVQEQQMEVSAGRARLHEREQKTGRKRPSSADAAVRRRPFSVMSFEPNVEGRSVESGYNLTAQLRMEALERKREEERKRKARGEREERERQERGRRRRLNNPVWENIKGDLEGGEVEQRTRERLEDERERTRQYR